MMTGARSVEGPATVVIAINIMTMNDLYNTRLKLDKANKLNENIQRAWAVYVDYKTATDIKNGRVSQVISHNGTVIAVLSPEKLIECTEGYEQTILKHYEDLCKQLIELFK